MTFANPQEFWTEVKSAVLEIQGDISKQHRQPKDGSCYIISLRQRGSSGARENVISLAMTKLAAQKLVEGTHRLATDAEITVYISDMAARTALAKAAAATRAGTVVLQAPRGV